MISRIVVILCLIALVACAKNGDTGPAGPIGLTGPSGSSGTDKFTQIMNCTYTITGLTGAAGTALNGLTLDYNFGLTTSGNVFVSGVISNAAYQITGTAFYGATQNGALVGGVAITNDYATTNGGYWTMTSNRILKVFYPTYYDSSLGVQSPVTMSPATSTCTTQNL